MIEAPFYVMERVAGEVISDSVPDPLEHPEQRARIAHELPTRREMITRYEDRSGRSTRLLNWYATPALWKAIVFMEGNYKRALQGSTDDPYLKSFGEGVVELAAARSR